MCVCPQTLGGSSRVGRRTAVYSRQVSSVQESQEWKPAHNSCHRAPSFSHRTRPCFSSSGHQGAAKCWCDSPAQPRWRAESLGTCSGGQGGRDGAFWGKGVCRILTPLGGSAEDGRAKIPGASPGDTGGGKHAPGISVEVPNLHTPERISWSVFPSAGDL
uniref:Uncharacterized protein n=1 Tax=Myotis myotis TaxID=51298 RepID=A0A7J7Z552_MYOMY|nr:hypothetical protein mMyoMyo1_010699 [Myotis myotis]